MDEKEKIEFEESLALRNLELNLFWQRSWFFGALLLAVVSGYFVNIEKGPFVPPICVSFLLVLISLFQSLMNRGSKYWQERWKHYTQDIEKSIRINVLKTEMPNSKERKKIDKDITDKKENFLTKSRKFSVSKLTILVWDIICLCSFMLWGHDIFRIFSSPNIDCYFTVKIVGFHLIIGIYIFLFWWRGRVFENINKQNN
ncbi:MAG: hypothetical protein FWC39_02555 [Bacteroidetes bacterium]|nr:hypothetical protein [Bacteroidota bacterium]